MQDVLSQHIERAHESLPKKLVQPSIPNNGTVGIQDFGTEHLTSLVTKPSGSSISTTGSLPLRSTYHGYLASKKDALLLIEGCMRGVLQHSHPPTHESPIKSGSIFVYHTTAPDGDFPLNSIGRSKIGLDNDFVFGPEFGGNVALMKKTLEVPDLGYIVVSYYNPNELEELSLKTPSKQASFQGIFLRAELACQDRQSALEMDIANTSTEIFSQFILNALVLCRVMIDDSQVKDLLQRKSNDWHPIFPAGTDWLDLCRQESFCGVTPEDLETQMIALLTKFFHLFGNDTPFQLAHHSQLSRKFSPAQNRRLFCEAFRVCENPARKIDWAKFEDEIAQSGIIKPRDIERKALHLMYILDLVHQKDDFNPLLSVRQMLEHLSINEFQNVIGNINYQIGLIPDFQSQENHTPLFLVECTTLAISSTSLKTKNMLQNWASSIEGMSICSQQLHRLRTSTSGPTLLLSLMTLSSFQFALFAARHGGFCRSEPEGLKALDRLIDGRVAIGSAESQVTLQDMLWSFSRATTHPSFRLLQEMLHRVPWPNSVPLGADRFTDHYWIARLLSHSDHKGAMTRFWHDMRHTVPKPTRDCSEYDVLPPQHMDSNPFNISTTPEDRG